MRKTLPIITLTFALLGGTSLATAQEIGEWDEDDDGVLAEEEFNAGFGETGVYSEWDEDGDGLLSEDEFNAGVYDTWDDDDSGAIEEEEWAEEEEGWF